MDGNDWQVIASHRVRRFPWFRPERKTIILYDGVTENQARALAEMLNWRDMGETYQARAKEQKGQSNGVHAQ